MTHSYVWHDSFIFATWLIHMCDMTHSYVWHDSFICEIWLIHMCDMTHLYVWHDSFICVTWLIHTCDMTHSYVRHDSFIHVTWLIHTCDMTHSYVRHDSFIRERMKDSVRYSKTWLIHICGMAHVKESDKKTRHFRVFQYLTYSISQNIGLFCKRALQMRLYCLQKRPVILRSLLIVATPYQTCTSESFTMSHMRYLISERLGRAGPIWGGYD